MLSQLATLVNTKAWIWKNDEPKGYALVGIELWAHIIPHLCSALHNFAQNWPCIHLCMLYSPPRSQERPAHIKQRDLPESTLISLHGEVHIAIYDFHNMWKTPNASCRHAITDHHSTIPSGLIGLVSESSGLREATRPSSLKGNNRHKKPNLHDVCPTGLLSIIIVLLQQFLIFVALVVQTLQRTSNIIDNALRWRRCCVSEADINANRLSEACVMI